MHPDIFLLDSTQKLCNQYSSLLDKSIKKTEEAKRLEEEMKDTSKEVAKNEKALFFTFEAYISF